MNSLQRRYPHLLISMARRFYICEILYLLSAGLMRDPHLPVSQAKHMKKRISSSQRHYRHLLINTFSPSYLFPYPFALSPILLPTLFPYTFHLTFYLPCQKIARRPFNHKGWL